VQRRNSHASLTLAYQIDAVKLLLAWTAAAGAAVTRLRGTARMLVE